MERARNVAVLMYEKVDLLDIAGPFDVFGVSSNWGKDFKVYTVGEEQKPVTTVSGLTIHPKYSFDNCPLPDILIVPGGLGSRTEMNNIITTSWISQTAASAEIVLSVCTGALLLAKANLLDGLRVTTNRNAFDVLREIVPPNATIVEDVRYVDNGKIVMSAGVTAGFDAALYVVARLFGEERALAAAAKIEYHWHKDEKSAAQQQNDLFVIRKAQINDVDEIQQLFVEAAQWIQVSKGFTQWRVDSFTKDYLTSFIHDQEVFVACQNGEIIGCFSIQWQYEEIWGDLFHDDAGYVHRLVVARKYKGEGIGSRILSWSEDYIKNKGKGWLRLDCMADNPTLNDYYRGLGFIHQGRYESHAWSAHLYERKIE
ncbi:GNAT family N-acetyltransferase [Paenibacillus qinlingensis]|uniref:GNAT family N-acetyltransferase n=1 Tax=Paenibacillus qinlingensis TaxID=1837343 RepID=UPI0015654C8C|nr:GNAT family N-acetyltransferase [Paenibacillus qinlingensis]NQX58266.1 GNAT family N-acetyltransferase [Paenibacillus qinlingensis]